MVHPHLITSSPCIAAGGVDRCLEVDQHVGGPPLHPREVSEELHSEPVDPCGAEAVQRPPVVQPCGDPVSVGAREVLREDGVGQGPKSGGVRFQRGRTHEPDRSKRLPIPLQELVVLPIQAGDLPERIGTPDVGSPKVKAAGELAHEFRPARVLLVGALGQRDPVRQVTLRLSVGPVAVRADLE